MQYFFIFRAVGSNAFLHPFSVPHLKYFEVILSYFPKGQIVSTIHVMLQKQHLVHFLTVQYKTQKRNLTHRSTHSENSCSNNTYCYVLDTDHTVTINRLLILILME
jgi:hypothetical protein